MRSPVIAFSVALTLLTSAARMATAASTSGEKPQTPQRERPDAVKKASRAVETQIENALKGRSMARAAADVAITGRIKTALLGDQTVSASDINVDTARGVVYLRGTVRSKAEAQRAVAVARKTFGVKAVKSFLTIVPSGKTVSSRKKPRAGSKFKVEGSSRSAPVPGSKFKVRGVASCQLSVVSCDGGPLRARFKVPGSRFQVDIARVATLNLEL